MYVCFPQSGNFTLFLQDFYEEIMVKLRREVLCLRVIPYLINTFIILLCSALRSILHNAMNTRPIAVNPTGIAQKRFVGNNHRLYRAVLIWNIYALNLIDAVIFDSLLKFPYGWLTDGLITLCLEKGPDLIGQVMEMVLGNKNSSMKYIDIIYRARLILLIITLYTVAMCGGWSYFTFCE